MREHMFVTKRIWKPFVAMRERIEARKREAWLRGNTWDGLIPGDTIQYKAKRLMYLGMSNKLHMEGPGGFGISEPVFIDPKAKPQCLYYIRPGRGLPEAFSEDAAQAGLDGTGLLAGFLNSDPALAPGMFLKTGHISADEWNRMLPRSEPPHK
jgi:hypothetical protein